VLLDISLPDGDGRDICRELRGRSDVPIIMLGARGRRPTASSASSSGSDDSGSGGSDASGRGGNDD